MNELALSNIQEMTPKQLKIMSRAHDKELLATTVNGIMSNVVKPLVAHPSVALVVSWLLIEQLNNHQAFGYTRQRSDDSASQIATIMLTVAAIDAVVPG